MLGNLLCVVTHPLDSGASSCKLLTSLNAIPDGLADGL
jgi:hypothetical protein